MRAAVGAGLVCMLIVLGASPAFADEFQVGILLDSSLSDSEKAAFMEGFQLAVDQSPDVSHPAGEEGGDHLGSMDIVIIVAETEGQPSEVLASALGLVDGGRPPIIVAHVSTDALALLIGPVTDSQTTLIAMLRADGRDLGAPSPFFFAAIEGSGVSKLLKDRSPAFEEAFSTATARPPTAAAARGYLAGRLVDLGVEATDRDPTDNQALVAAMLEATGPAAPDRPANAPESTAAADTVAAAEASPSSSKGWLVAVAASLAFLLVVGLAVGATRRHRGRSA